MCLKTFPGFTFSLWPKGKTSLYNCQKCYQKYKNQRWMVSKAVLLRSQVCKKIPNFLNTLLFYWVCKCQTFRTGHLVLSIQTAEHGKCTLEIFFLKYHDCTPEKGRGTGGFGCGSIVSSFYFATVMT